MIARRLLPVMVLLVAVAVLAGGCQGHPQGLKIPTTLTDSEKARVIEIALNTQEAQVWIKPGAKYQTKLQWVAIVWHGNEAAELRYFEYENVQNDPNYHLVPPAAEWYPGAVIHVGDPSVAVIQVAVDLKSGKAVDVSASPDLSNPGRFPTPPPVTVPPQ